MGRVLTAAAAVVGLLGGCVLDEVDLSNRSCPCGPGWICDEDLRRCVLFDDLPRDGGMDAMRPDGGSDPDGGLEVDAAVPDGGGSDPDSGTTQDGGPSGTDAGRDAGTDAGPADAGLDSTACDDLYAGALFCDGFEDTGLGAWGWQRHEDGTTARSTSQIYRGLGSLRATTTAGSGRASRGSSYATVTGGELWVRLYVYVPGGYAIDTLSFVVVAEAADPYLGVALQAVTSNRVHVWVGSDGSAHERTATIPRDRWFCYRARIALSETAGEVEVWVDDTLAYDGTGLDTIPDTGYTNVTAGIEWSAAGQEPAEIWIDEVVVDDAEVLCD